MKANPELEPTILQPGNRATGQRLSLRCASTAPNVIALSPKAFDGLAGFGRMIRRDGMASGRWIL